MRGIGPCDSAEAIKSLAAWGYDLLLHVAGGGVRHSLCAPTVHRMRCEQKSVFVKRAKGGKREDGREERWRRGEGRVEREKEGRARG
eukprot:1131130-Rhodomonas_salina.1